MKFSLSICSTFDTSIYSKMTTDDMPFKIIQQSAASLARTGVLTFARRSQIKTPGFIIPTSRGAVPHLSPDNVIDALPEPTGFYVAAEDFLEKLPGTPPLFEYPTDSENGARDFLCLPTQTPLVASVRKSVPVLMSSTNSDTTVCVSTAEGCRDLPIEKYFEFVKKMRPDVVLAIPDFPQSGTRPGGNRVRKMLYRTERWFEELVSTIAKQQDGAQPLIFAPVLPSVDLRAQGAYLDFLASKRDYISGLTMWNTTGNATEKKTPLLPESWQNVVDAIEGRDLDQLPRYNCAGVFQSPLDILELIASSGSDLFNGDLATIMTNAGVALDFTFPAPDASTNPVYGFNLWERKYKVDTSGFGVAVPDYCAPHNRAFIHHLLDAHEMTAHVLLQKHNLNVLLHFFEGVRTTIDNGTFEAERERFERVYEGQTMVELRDRCADITPTVKAYTK